MKKISLENFGVSFKDSQKDKKTIYPTFHQEGSETFLLAREYLNQDLKLGVEYLEINACIIIGYYVRSGSKFDRRILVIKNEDVILDILQDSDLTGYASGSYFLMEQYLIFIVNSTQINGIKI